MSDHFDDFETEALEAAWIEIELLPEDRQALEEALNDSLEIFSAPAQADGDEVFRTIEVLEEIHPSFSDAQIADQIGELIEFLQEIADGEALSFEDCQRGKSIIQDLAEILGISLWG